jgi:hypothetical protein
MAREVRQVEPPSAGGVPSDRIVDLFTRIDQAATRALKEVGGSARSSPRYTAAYARFRSQYQQMGRELVQLGVYCRPTS